MERTWLVEFTTEHARVIRAALTLGLSLGLAPGVLPRVPLGVAPEVVQRVALGQFDSGIDFVCEMFAAQHGGDVEGESRMAERFDRKPDDPVRLALREAFALLVQASAAVRLPAEEINDLGTGLEKIETAGCGDERRTSATLTSAELSSLRTACELYTRLAIGQGWAVAGYLGCPEDAAQAAQAFDRRFREIFFPELQGDAYYGINSQLVHDNARVAWDVLQVVRQHLAFDSLGKVVGRDKRDIRTMKGPEFDDPMQRSRLELIRCAPEIPRGRFALIRNIQPTPCR